MNIKDEDMEWKTEAPTLAALPKITPYSVPDNYFGDLTNQINSAVFLSELTSEKGDGFTVPINYFEELNGQIKSRIALEKIKSVGFTTPANYFDKLQANIVSQTIDSKPERKIVSLWNSDLIRYVSAACFILLTASALYFNQQSAIKETHSTELASEQMLYDIDESVIIEHLNESQTATNSNASQAEMERYILDHYSSTDLSNNL